MRCNGCGTDPKIDQGILEKVERLISIGVETVHIGVCRKHEGQRCNTIASIMEMLSEKGIEIVDETHLYRSTRRSQKVSVYRQLN